MMSEQLAFDLPLRPALGRENFFVSPSNALALAIVDGWENWPSGKLVLVGPDGAGKTHLARMWADEHDAVIIKARDLPGAVIDALAACRFVVVEDADLLCDPDCGFSAQAAQDALFHLHNLTLAEGGCLLLTASSPPSRWPLTLPDLRSRMEATTVAQLESPDDTLLSAMLLKLFTDRQLAVTPGLITYIVRRMTRSHAAACDLVAALDALALSQGKPVSQTMAATLFESDMPGVASM
jgi:chromosomal replication initiation ATPase DnaA